MSELAIQRRRAKRPRVERICELCSVPFLCAPSVVDAGKGRYCSRACYNAGRVRSPLHSCECCGTQFRVKPAEVARGWGRYCSRSCQSRAKFTGAANPRWAGGRSVSRYGYVMVKGPGGRRVPEHRLLLESSLGRPLRADEIVHHLNHDKTDNRLENLAITTRTAHVGLHRHVEGRWALHYAACRCCDTTTVPHSARGLCDNCYVRLRARGNLSDYEP